MFDLNKLVAEAYENERNKDFSFDRLVEMVESMMILQESLGIVKEEAPVGAKITKTQDLKPVKISWRPYVPMSEVRLGSITYKDSSARDVDGDGNISASEQNPARAQLRRFLDGLPQGDIKVKVNALNEYINGITAQDKSLQSGLTNGISFMVFYRTIYDILTDFNASAAGFIFESFLSVLLDADRGHQIPASGAKTIADFIVYPNGQKRLPISLKLYAADTLKVGGSYIQLIEDLTGELGMMQYIVITKLTGDNKEIEELRFYGFNFTLDNVSQILALTGEMGYRQMCLPTSVVQAYGANENVAAVSQLLRKTGKIAGASFVRTRAGGGASELDPTGQFQTPGRYRYDIGLDIPAATKISIKPAIEAIKASLNNQDSTPMSVFLLAIKNNDNKFAGEVKNAFMGALDQDFKVLNIADELEIGQSRTDEKIYAYTSSGKEVNIKGPTRAKIFDAVYALLTDEQKVGFKSSYSSRGNKDPLSTMIIAVIANGKAAQEDVPKPEAGKDPRSQRIQAIYGDFSEEQRKASVAILNNAAFKGVEKKKLLKLTAGYQGVGGDSQFEIKTKAAFDQLYNVAAPLPYASEHDDGAFAVLQLTEQKVLEVQNYVLDSFNENMANALNAMQKLVDNMNTYVVGGLTDSRKAEDASTNAGEVKTSMEEQVRESAQNNTETP